MNLIGTRIREAREALRWTQAELGDAMGVTRGAVSQWETGETQLSLSRLSRLAEVLAVDEAWLRTGRGSKQAPGAKTTTREEWREALILAEIFSDQLRENGQQSLSPQEKIELAEQIAPHLGAYLQKAV